LEYRKPLPAPTPVTRRYWEALREHRLLIQKCMNCGSSVFYPRMFCPKCLSNNLEWVESEGKGRLLSFTILYSTSYPEFNDDLPFVLGFVELREGVNMIANIVDCKPEELKVDMEVGVVFDDVTEELTLPRFNPVRRSTA